MESPMKCQRCGKKRIEKKAKFDDGIEYSYYQCGGCGDEILTMDQLNQVVEKYRGMKRITAKVSKWGDSLAIRFPKVLAEKYNLKKGTEVRLVPEKKAIKIVAA